MTQPTIAEIQSMMDLWVPDRSIQKIYVDIFTTGIQIADKIDSNEWNISAKRTPKKEHGIRLKVANYRACTIDSDGIWFALDCSMIEQKNRNNTSQHPTFSQLKTWGWQEYPDPKEPNISKYKDRRHVFFSINGYYSGANNHNQNWHKIEPLFKSFIYKALHEGQRMQDRWRKKHHPNLLDYFRQEFGKSNLPNPAHSP